MIQQKTRLNVLYTLPETNSSPLKMDGWNTTFLLGWPIFRGYVSFREGRVVIVILMVLTEECRIYWTCLVWELFAIIGDDIPIDINPFPAKAAQQ